MTDWATKYDAPKNHIWVCTACGKKAANKANGPGLWDESCFLNAVLVNLDTYVLIEKRGRVTEVCEKGKLIKEK